MPIQQKRTHGIRLEQRQFNVETDLSDEINSENQEDEMQIEEQQSSTVDDNAIDIIAMSVASKKRYELFCN